MRKIFFTLVLVLITLMSINAQDIPLATLQNAEGTQVFYGADAFKEAMAIAEHGDVITLTAGTFNATTITKAVSIYGTGYEMDAKMKMPDTGEGITQIDNELPQYPTRLVGDFSITLDLINEQPAEGLHIEGIYSDNAVFVGSKLVAASFVKCRFQDFNFWKIESTMMESKDCLLSQCRIAQWLEPGVSQSMTINNCIINYLGRNNDSSTILIQNSFIGLMPNQLRGVIKNCIIGVVRLANDSFHHFETGFGYEGGTSFHPNCSSIHNMLGNVEALNEVVTKDGNWININLATTLFGETGIKTYSDTYMYELTDEAKATYIGTDGKEIGIYGGTSPFSPILTIPRIVKKDIAAETVDGKLKVNIKVETGDNSL